MIDAIRQTLQDERGVSPVLGVALLIAITVTLVAVVGIVVMGVNPGGTNAPSAKLAFHDQNATDGTLEVAHNGGDALNTSSLTVKGPVNATLTSGELTAGDSFTINDAEQGDQITIVWNDPESDKTTVLAKYTV